MAQKRMFDKSITNSDNFLELPDSSQILYFHLSMNADDDGFIDNWKSIMRMTGTKEDDLKILITKSYVIPFDSGVIVIRHWRMNNYLRSDRYKETTHKEEKKLLSLGENEEYLLQSVAGIPLVDTDKNRIEENSIDKYSIKNNFKQNLQCEAITKGSKERCLRKSSFNINGINYCNQHAREMIPDIEIQNEKFKKPTLEEIQEYCKERNNDVNAKQFFDYYEVNNWIDNKGNKVKNWKQKLITWEKHSYQKEKDVPKWFDKDLSNIQTIDNDPELEELLKDIEGG